jgi:haloalkane dehalogenase
MGWDFIERVPGVQGQPHTTIAGGGHFIQKNRPAEVVKVMIDFIRGTKNEVQTYTR